MRKQYFGFRLSQREEPGAVHFFVFAASTDDIMKWSTVDRLQERRGGIQRRISDARLRAIERFFKENPLNTIPTSIVLAFLPGVAEFRRLESDCIEDSWSNDLDGKLEWGTLSFDFDPNIPPLARPALVVDGQHRLFGMGRVQEERLPVVVSALLDAEPNEQAFQFVVINNKVTRVPSDLVRSLIVDFDEHALQDRLQVARVSLQPHALLVAIVDDEPESPLYQMVDWERRRGEGQPAVKPAAIEDSLKYIRRLYPALDEDRDALIDYFFAMWSGVKDAYPDLWSNTDNRLFANAGFKAFSEYLTDQIEALAGIDYVDVQDPDSVRQVTRTLASQIDVLFWRADWKLKSLDTSAGHEVIKDNLKVIRQNKRDKKEWYAGLSLVGIEAEAGEDENSE